MDDLTAIPSTITAGDSYGVVLSWSDYPATAGWSLGLAIAGPSVDSWTSTASGADHRFTITAVDTAALLAGTYQYRLRATKGTDVRTVETGTLVVTADLGTLIANEAVSFAEKTLPIVEAALSGTIDGEMKMYMIGGRQVQTFSPDELLRLRSQLRAEIDATRNRTFGAPVRFDVVGMR